MLQKKITSLNKIKESVENWLEVIERQLEHERQEGLDEVRLDVGDVGVVRTDDVAILEQVLEQPQARSGDCQSRGFVLKRTRTKAIMK